MLQVASTHPLHAIEPAIRHAAHRNEASVLAIAPVGQLLRDSKAGGDAIVFTVCHPELYTALLEADIRMAAFLPCRIAAWSDGGHVSLGTVSPLEFCRLLNRSDLAPLAVPLETLLRRILADAAEAVPASVHAAAGVHRGGLGATEEQVNLRASVPQRIDCHGSKVEDMAGTGEHDAQGG